MAKKQKQHKPVKITKSSFDPENSKYFTPLSFLVIFIGLVILFSDFIFSSKMLRGSDMIEAGIFFRSMLVDSVLENGTVPQWNPYIFGGMPYVEAFHGDIFYPLSFMKFFGSIYRSLGYVQFFHIFFAGLFMYFCAREFKLSKVTSLLSGICYMFASYLISMVAPGHDGKIFVTALFPLMILFLERGCNSEQLFKAIFNFSVLGLVIGFIILSPHIQMMYFSLWALSFYAAFRLISGYVKSKSIPGFLRPALLTTYAVVIGILLSAIQFYPGYTYTSEFSPRTDSKSGWEWATSWSIHEEEAFSQLVPEYSGVMSSNPDYSQATFYWGKNAFKDNSETVSIIGIFLAILAMFIVRKKEAYFFGGLALFAFIYALGGNTPIFKLFFHLIPKVKSLRAPSMIMFLFSFSIALLAGMGLQKIMDDGRKFSDTVLKRFNIILFGFPALLLLIALLFSMNGKGMIDIWSSIFYSDVGRMFPQGYSKLDLAYRNLSVIQSGAWLSFLFTALAAGAIWLYRSGKAGVMVLCALLALPMINSIRFNKRFISTVDQQQQWGSNVVTNFFTNNPGQYRVMNFSQGMIKEDLLPHFGVDVVVGYHGNQLKWYDNLLGGPGKINQANPHFLNLVGAKYILFPGNQNFPANYFGEKPVFQAANFGQLQVVQNDNAFDRVYLVDSFEVITVVDTSSYNQILSGQYNLQEVVLLEEKPELTYVPDTLKADSAWIVDYQPEEITINLSVKQNKILVLADNYYDAWEVYIDGKQGKILRAYGSFRAVEIPQGTNEVRFKYKSNRYETSRMVTWLTGLYLIIIIGFYFVAGHRRNQTELEEE